MKFTPKFFRCKKGLETVTGVLMLFLMFAVMIGLIAAFLNYNTSAQLQMGNDGQRSAEQIALAEIKVDQNPLKVTITNIGTTEVTISTLYKTLNGQAIYYCDAPTYNSETNIPVGKNLTLSFPSGVTLGEEEKIVVATSRGTKTIDQYLPKPSPTPIFTFDSSKYLYGNIELQWEEFEYKSWNNNFNPGGQWLPGWMVSNPQSNVAWKVTITNIGDKTIILNEQSSFTLDPTSTDSQSSPARRSWFLYSEPTSQPQTTTLLKDTPVTVLFVWSNPTQQNYLGIYSQSCVCMAFLTFFGHYDDINNSPYAQTIPFEAAITVT
jgi:hypothetical protein